MMIISRIIRWLGFIFLVMTLIMYAREATKVVKWQRSGSVYSRVQPKSDSVMVFWQVHEADYLQSPLPRAGDTLLTIGDTTATYRRAFRTFAAPRPVGEIVPVAYLIAGDSVRNELRMAQPPLGQVIWVSLLHVLRFFVSISGIAVGLWAIRRRPESRGVRVLALFAYALGLYCMVQLWILQGTFAGFNLPYFSLIYEALVLFSSLFPAFWLHLALEFPRRLPWFERRPIPGYLICYLLPVLHAAVSLDLFSWSYDTTLWLDAVLLVPIALAGILLLFVRYYRCDEKVEQRRIRLVLWGSGFGLLLWSAMVFVVPMYGSWFWSVPSRLWITLTLVNLILLLSPLSFAYAFTRYRLLDVEGRLRRGTRYVLTTGFTLLIFGIAGYALISVLANLTTPDYATPVSVIVALALAVALAPGQKRVHRVIERRFYPERERLRGLIGDFLEQASSLSDRKTYWAMLQTRLRDGLDAQGVFPLVRIEGNRVFLLAEEEATPFEAESTLMQLLSRSPRPTMLDEVMAGKAVELQPEERVWLVERQIALLLPLMMHGQLGGCVALAVKSDAEDYAPEELNILQSLAPQMSLACENLRLIKESEDKRRLAEELEMARRIQTGFLPQVLPDTPGLEVAVRSRFCHEVAGDYYDVIVLDDGRTVLAVGDVSGKGAGAAMIMANLQAALRTAVRLSPTLEQVVSEINTLVYRNTPPEKFVTFFAALFDPTERLLTFVNAGHNPPVIIHPDGSQQLLEDGGVVLGIVPGILYTQTTIRLQPGARILMFTDGVSETENAGGEQFGEERLPVLLHEAGDLSLNHQADHIDRAVVTHHGGDRFDDDYTLMLVQVSD